MRAYLAYAVAMVCVIIVAVQPAAAFTEMGIPFISSCGFVYMQPFSSADLTITEFNSARAASLDFETLDIDFPMFSDGFSAGPAIGPFASDGISLGAGASSNVLPFGPVNLAFPSINQTVLQQAEYERTYFFIDVVG